MLMNLQDDSLNRTKALPNGAAATSTDAIDLNNGPNDQFTDNVEFLLTAPALDATAQPDTKTLIYKLEQSVDGVTWTTLYERIFTQTGAGGVGVAAKSQRFRVPSNVARYIRVTATGSASGNASASSFTLTTLF